TSKDWRSDLLISQDFLDRVRRAVHDLFLRRHLAVPLLPGSAGVSPANDSRYRSADPVVRLAAGVRAWQRRHRDADAEKMGRQPLVGVGLDLAYPDRCRYPRLRIPLVRVREIAMTKRPLAALAVATVGFTLALSDLVHGNAQQFFPAANGKTI